MTIDNQHDRTAEDIVKRARREAGLSGESLLDAVGFFKEMLYWANRPAGRPMPCWTVVAETWLSVTESWLGHVWSARCGAKHLGDDSHDPAEDVPPALLRRQGTEQTVSLPYVAGLGWTLDGLTADRLGQLEAALKVEAFRAGRLPLSDGGERMLALERIVEKRFGAPEEALPHLVALLEAIREGQVLKEQKERRVNGWDERPYEFESFTKDGSDAVAGTWTVTCLAEAVAKSKGDCPEDAEYRTIPGLAEISHPELGSLFAGFQTSRQDWGYVCVARPPAEKWRSSRQS